MVLVDHTQTSEGFTGGFSVGVRVAGALSHEDHHVAPKSAPGVVLSVDVLWWIHYSNAFQAEYQ